MAPLALMMWIKKVIAGLNVWGFLKGQTFANASKALIREQTSVRGFKDEAIYAGHPCAGSLWFYSQKMGEKPNDFH